MAGVGRSTLPGVRSGENSPSPSWDRRTRPSKSLSRCCPRSRSVAEAVSSRSGAVVGETRICPPCPSAAMRAARCTSRPTYPSVVTVATPVCSPFRTRIGPVARAPAAASAAVAAPSAVGKATKNASPCVSTSTPPALATASRSSRRCSSSAAAYSSGPSSCSSRVEPSTSVKRKVTVPLGRSARIRPLRGRSQPRASANRSAAKSMSSSECAADICVLIRAVPLGTTGNEKLTA